MLAFKIGACAVLERVQLPRDHITGTGFSEKKIWRKNVAKVREIHKRWRVKNRDRAGSSLVGSPMSVNNGRMAVIVSLSDTPYS